MILFYSEEITPRMEYVASVLFRNILNVEIEFTSNSSEFQKSEKPKINYSFEKFDDEFYIKPHRLLHCKALINPNYKSVWHKGEKYFFESSKDSDLPFDPFAATFFLITRYEEYTETEKGKYNRYPAEKSILSKYNWVKKPLVNYWALEIAALLSEKYPELHFPKNKFRFFSTIDVDNAWAFKNKGFWRTSAAFLNDVAKGNFEQAKIRLKVLSGKMKDPYDTYEFLNAEFKGNEKWVKFFFLVGDYAKYDKSCSIKNRAFQRLIQEVSSKFEVGVHPSFSSNKKKGLKKIIKEKQRMAKVSAKEIGNSRQHFLKLSFPKTYRRLIKAGIKNDFSMGYSSQIGFRAGICTPYPFYDLKKEQTTNLMIVPFQVMDVTLRDYLHLSPEEAWTEIKNLMNEVKNVGGTFVSIWHNETVNDLDGWKGYRNVFTEMNKLGFNWANE